MKKHTKYLTLPVVAVIAAAMLFGSCSKDPQSPGFEYFPDMYRSPSVETNGMNPLMADSMGNMLPPDHAIARGWMPYPYDNTVAGDSLASLNWKSPLPQNDAVENDGKALYEKFCVHCHGDAGKGDGTIVTNGKFPNKPPDYTSFTGARASEGHIYQTIYYGKGMMGSHASQLNINERWQVVRYVQRLIRGDVSLEEAMKKAVADSAKADSAAKAPKAPVVKK